MEDIQHEFESLVEAYSLGISGNETWISTLAMKIMDLDPVFYLQPNEQQMFSEICLQMGKHHLLEKNCVAAEPWFKISHGFNVAHRESSPALVYYAECLLLDDAVDNHSRIIDLLYTIKDYDVPTALHAFTILIKGKILAPSNLQPLVYVSAKLISAITSKFPLDCRSRILKVIHDLKEHNTQAVVCILDRVPWKSADTSPAVNSPIPHSVMPVLRWILAEVAVTACTENGCQEQCFDILKAMSLIPYHPNECTESIRSILSMAETRLKSIDSHPEAFDWYSTLIEIGQVHGICNSAHLIAAMSCSIFLDCSDGFDWLENYMERSEHAISALMALEVILHNHSLRSLELLARVTSILIKVGNARVEMLENIAALMVNVLEEAYSRFKEETMNGAVVWFAHVALELSLDSRLKTDVRTKFSDVAAKLLRS